MAKPIRVLRLLEYTYDSAESMVNDQLHWQVQGVYRPNSKMVIKSTVLPLEVIEPTACEFCVCGNPIYGKWDDTLNAVVFKHEPCDRCGSLERHKVQL